MSIEYGKFRQVLGHFPTGVTVVTATAHDGEPVGLTDCLDHRALERPNLFDIEQQLK